MISSPLPEGRRRVVVSLSEVNPDLRYKVAETIAQRGKLRGIAYAEMMLAAVAPRQNPKIPVPADKAEQVLRDGKLPLGPMPKVWQW